VVSKSKENWKSEPDEHDYPAADNYLSLLLPPAAVAEAVRLLRSAELVRYKAKDLLRASRLPLLPAKDPDVARDLREVRAGRKLSPVLVLRGDLGREVPLTVADGYHRICASYHLNEDAEIPCRLAGLAIPDDSPEGVRPKADRGRPARSKGSPQ
jgi:hypothetical protein